MKQTDNAPVIELAAHIAKEEGLPWKMALVKACQQVAALERYAHQWDQNAFAAGNMTASDPKKN